MEHFKQTYAINAKPILTSQNCNMYLHTESNPAYLFMKSAETVRPSTISADALPAWPGQFHGLTLPSCTQDLLRLMEATVSIAMTDMDSNITLLMSST